MNSMKRSLSFHSLNFHSLNFRAALAVAAITFSLAVCAKAQTFTNLAAFNGTNGAYPDYGSLIQATNGNYYGTAVQGGTNGDGVVFEVTPAGKLSDLYSFCAQNNCADGAYPLSGLALGSDGNFYGTTNQGGNNSYSGTIFKMTIGGKLTTLYSFCPAGGNCTDGQYPNGLIQASNGNFYGTASNGGGNYNGGTIFEISSAGKFKKLYTFCSRTNCNDGYSPQSGPMQASNGNLYGAAYYGGSQSSGVVYEITTAGVFKVLYNFCSQANCADGQYPFGGLIQGTNGNLYGTTENGGANGYGTVFEITSTNEFIVLHSFDNTDGSYPVSALLQASDGNFYGTTYFGGGANAAGTIFEITSAGVFSSLYSVCLPSSCNGYNPSYALAQATDGAFIGTTNSGGYDADGNVFSYSTGLGPLVETVPVAAKVGKRVIILGNGLTGSSSVTFNGTAATFTVVSATEITATVPTGATTGTVAVTTPTGILNSNPVFQVLP
jgi:uncharacterized repeat protein (TIGR03803 family)